MAVLHNVVFDCRNALELAAFWKEALGWEYWAREEGWVSLRPPGEDDAMSVAFGPVPEGKTVKNRVHLDIRPAPGVGWEEERTRLEELGATTLQYFEDAHYIMADPEGNEFCLLNPKWYNERHA